MGTNRFIKLLDWLNHHDWPPATVSPVKAAATASLVSFLFIGLVDGPLVTRLGIWWAELLAFSLVPLLLAFVILYRSSWHQALAEPARAALAALYAMGIFAAALVALFVALVLLVLVYNCYPKDFTAFH
jgi:hypothetical protein